MPLSEHEQRLLDQIEQALYAEDPKFASSVRSVRRRSHKRRGIVLSAAGVLVGLALVLVGLIATIVALSVVGFVLIVASCFYATQVIRALRSGQSGGTDSGEQRGKPAKPSGLRGRMEERIRRRFDES